MKATGYLTGICLTIMFIIAWFTHVIWAIQTLASDKGATVGQAVLGVLGSCVPPIGVIHGIMIWFGVGI